MLTSTNWRKIRSDMEPNSIGLVSKHKKVDYDKVFKKKDSREEAIRKSMGLGPKEK